MEILDNILTQHYGWEVVALLFAIVIFFAVQICYYGFRYRKINKYRVSQRMRIMETPPPVSVVVPMYNDNSTFIEDQLANFVAQEGVEFEVVIVYVGSNRDFYDDLCGLSCAYPNLTVTKIESDGKRSVSNKLALNIGIKAAKYDHIIFTTTDCTPTNSKWLSLMRQGFQFGEIVLGYCGMDRFESDDEEIKKGGALSYRLIQTGRMMESANWLSAAIMRRGYRGIRTNIGFTKTLYNKVKGFNHLNMSIGDDDLFMQKIMTKENTSVVIAPRATLRQICWGGLGWWNGESRIYSETLPLYNQEAKNYMNWELTSRLGLFISSLWGLIFLPLELKALIALLLIIRLVVVLLSVNSIAKRLGEEGIVKGYILHDILSPLFTLWVRRPFRKGNEVWR